MIECAVWRTWPSSWPSQLTSFAVSFTQDVSASLSPTDLIVTNDSTGATLDLSGTSLSWDALTNTRRLGPERRGVRATTPPAFRPRP